MSKLKHDQPAPGSGWPQVQLPRSVGFCTATLRVIQPPSRADIDMTKQVVEAGRVLGITVHDNLVVGSGGVARVKALGLS